MASDRDPCTRTTTNLSAIAGCMVLVPVPTDARDSLWGGSDFIALTEGQWQDLPRYTHSIRVSVALRELLPAALKGHGLLAVNPTDATTVCEYDRLLFPPADGTPETARVWYSAFTFDRQKMFDLSPRQWHRKEGCDGSSTLIKHPWANRNSSAIHVCLLSELDPALEWVGRTPAEGLAQREDPTSTAGAAETIDLVPGEKRSREDDAASEEEPGGKRPRVE